jgi:hypothetical protein
VVRACLVGTYSADGVVVNSALQCGSASSGRNSTVIADDVTVPTQRLVEADLEHDVLWVGEFMIHLACERECRLLCDHYVTE